MISPRSLVQASRADERMGPFQGRHETSSVLDGAGNKRLEGPGHRESRLGRPTGMRVVALGQMERTRPTAASSTRATERDEPRR